MLEHVNLEDMKLEIDALVREKGFYNHVDDIPKKLLFAFIELGEASDAWKKGEAEEKIAEELIDVLFYVLDASRLACPNIDMDVMFLKKLKKNRRRKYQYGEGHRRGLRAPVSGASRLLRSRLHHYRCPSHGARPSQTMPR